MLPDRTCRPSPCPLAPACPLLQLCLSTSRLPSQSSGFAEGNTAGVGRSVAQTPCCVRPHGEEPQEPGRTAAPALWTPSPGGAGAGKAGGGGVRGRCSCPRQAPVQFSHSVRLFVTPMDCSTPGKRQVLYKMGSSQTLGSQLACGALKLGIQLMVPRGGWWRMLFAFVRVCGKPRMPSAQMMGLRRSGVLLEGP